MGYRPGRIARVDAEAARRRRVAVTEVDYFMLSGAAGFLLGLLAGSPAVRAVAWEYLAHPFSRGWVEIWRERAVIHRGESLREARARRDARRTTPKPAGPLPQSIEAQPRGASEAESR
jgi:hypothetical protein